MLEYYFNNIEKYYFNNILPEIKTQKLAEFFDIKLQPLNVHLFITGMYWARVININ